MPGKNAVRWISLCLSLLLVFSGSIPVFAVQERLSLSDHEDTVAVYLADSVKILTGFLPGDTLADAALRFDCGENMLFLSPEGTVLPYADTRVSTGTLVLVTDGESVLDIGLFAVFGDVNGDGYVKTADARAMLRYATQLDDMPEAVSFAADCNADGKVSTTDARMALRAAVGLSALVNPVGRLPETGEALAIYAYYTGEDPQAGSTFDPAEVQVVAVYSDASHALITEGFTIEPTPLTSERPGEAEFTVRWKGLSCVMRVNFRAREPDSFYPDSLVPDFDHYAGKLFTQSLYQIGYVAYIYSADRNVTDFVLFESYLHYLEACGFVCAQKTIDATKVAALFEKSGSESVAAIYDFTGRQIIIAVENR